jgi:hypothetical protein
MPRSLRTVAVAALAASVLTAGVVLSSPAQAEPGSAAACAPLYTGTTDSLKAYTDCRFDGPPVTPSPTPTPTVAPPVPTPSTSTTAPATGRKVPLVGKSQLGWNNVVFHENSTDPAEFVTWRKRDVDGTFIFPGRESWDAMGWMPTRRSNDLLVFSLPFAPEGQGITNSEVAAGQVNTQIRTLAAKMKAGGWNTDRTVIRLAWENNGNWYEWSQDKGGSAAYAAAFRQWVTQARAAGLTNVRFTWNVNKGPQSYNSGVSWTAGYPGDGYVDVVGIDPYDMWSPTRTDADWTYNTTGRNPGLADVASFARAHGKQMAIDEWGVVHASGQAGGGDNPFYVAKMAAFVKANRDVLAYETTYDDRGAPSTWRHDLSYGYNPLAAAEYCKTWGATGCGSPLSR